VGLDVYGTVDPEVAPAFQASLERTPTARYLGVFRGDAPALLAGYDAVVLPTWFSREGHPGVIVEAMMAGVPVVSTVHMAIPELIRDGENGLLVPPRDVEALAGAIRRLADDPGERAAMGAAHRRRLDRHDALVAAGRLLVWIESARDRPVGVHA
jgi:glycosyltransferase involved in cell wall biosynthesis